VIPAARSLPPPHEFGEAIRLMTGAQNFAAPYDGGCVRRSRVPGLRAIVLPEYIVDSRRPGHAVANAFCKVLIFWE